VLSWTSRILLVIGVVTLSFVAYEFVLTGLPHDRSQVALLAAFKAQVGTTTLDAPDAVAPESSAVALIQAPAIGLDQVVVEGTSPQDLQSGPGHLQGTSMPGEYGNAVIVGRRTTYGGPFSALDRLRIGDQVRVTTGQGSFTYVVTGVERVRTGARSPMGPSNDSRLTLVTSDPAFLAADRLVVTGRLRGDPAYVPNRPPVTPALADLGLTGDPLGLGVGLLWGELLLAAILVAWRLRNKWPRSVLIMLAAPVMLGLGLLTFSSVDRFLPGTL